jgi:hypothetical protein
MFGEEYKLWSSSLGSFLQSSVIREMKWREVGNSHYLKELKIPEIYLKFAFLSPISHNCSYSSEDNSLLPMFISA